MGLFDFVRAAGKEIAEERAENQIQRTIDQALDAQKTGGGLKDLVVKFDDGVAALSGTVDSEATRQKAILIAGNIRGVARVNDDNLVVNRGMRPAKVEMQTLPRAEIKKLDIPTPGGATIGSAPSFGPKPKEGPSIGNAPNFQNPAPQPEPEFVFYTIAPGDSLSKIAKRVYGDPMKWPDLFEANKEVIQNPDLIYPGQVIRVPKS